MRTRIEITEYNNGAKKFACQEDTFKIDSNSSAAAIWLAIIALIIMCKFFDLSLIYCVLFVAFVCVVFFIQYKMGAFSTIDMELPPTIEIKRCDPLPEYTPAVFDTLEEAKAFLDKYIKEKTSKLERKQGETIKSTTYEKYP